MRIKTWLILGRVSNLPTVWTNVLAAAVIAHVGSSAPILSLPSDVQAKPFFLDHWGNSVSWLLLLYTLLALSLMYIGGMFLNDAFDEKWDRTHGNPRPIVNGEVSGRSVGLMGSSLLVAAVIIIAYVYQKTLLDLEIKAAYQEFYGLFASILLALTIIIYNWAHKQFAHSSAFIMGACRFWVYVIAALLLAKLTVLVVFAGISLLLYIAGLTFLARNEHIRNSHHAIQYWPLLLLFAPVLVASFPGFDTPYFWFFLLIFIAWVFRCVSRLLWQENQNIGACIGGLLAAIPLVDGLMLASVKAVEPSIICLLVFLLMPSLHRWVSGT